MISKARITAVLVFLSSLLVSCNLLISKTPDVTIAWQPDGNGYIKYSTNDSSKLGYGEFIYYSESYQAAPSSFPGATVAVNLKKASGASESAYGMIFCCQDTNDFYRVLICSETGCIRIDKKVSGNYETIEDWLQYGNLYQSLQELNVLHSIQVPQSSANSYSLIVDGQSVFTFHDTSLPNSGYSGFYLTIADSTEENFPFDPEDVRFQLTSPTTVPDASMRAAIQAPYMSSEPLLKREQ